MTAFTIRVHREEDHYWAEVAEMPGSFATGNNLAELGESLDEAVALWQDDQTSQGYVLERLILGVADALDDADFERPTDAAPCGPESWRHYAEWLVRGDYVTSKFDDLAAARYSQTFDRNLTAYIAARPERRIRQAKTEETP